MLTRFKLAFFIYSERRFFVEKLVGLKNMIYTTSIMISFQQKYINNTASHLMIYFGDMLALIIIDIFNL